MPKLLNMSLYVEGGVPPKIHSHAKCLSPEQDVDYNQKIGRFTQQEQHLGRFELTDGRVTADASVTAQGEIVYTGSVFEVKTVGGARFTQAIDICIDGEYEHSFLQILRRAKRESFDYMPKQVEHTITSNSIKLWQGMKFSHITLQADPQYSALGGWRLKQGDKVLDDDAKRRIPPIGCDAMTVKEEETGYRIESPPFGFSYIIEVIAERTASTYDSPDLTEAIIDEHNDRVISHKFHLMQQVIKKPLVTDHHSAIAAILVSRIKMLEGDLEKCCKPSWLQEVLGKLGIEEEDIQKIKSMPVIKEKLSFIKKLISDERGKSLFVIESWKDSLLSYAAKRSALAESVNENETQFQFN